LFAILETCKTIAKMKLSLFTLSILSFTVYSIFIIFYFKEYLPDKIFHHMDFSGKMGNYNTIKLLYIFPIISFISNLIFMYGFKHPYQVKGYPLNEIGLTIEEILDKKQGLLIYLAYITQVILLILLFDSILRNIEYRISIVFWISSILYLFGPIVYLLRFKNK
jgi:hypothetical protein